jgi:hypothetical protein
MISTNLKRLFWSVEIAIDGFGIGGSQLDCFNLMFFRQNFVFEIVEHSLHNHVTFLALQFSYVLF